MRPRFRESDTEAPDVEGAPARLSAISLPDVAATHRVRCRARRPKFDQQKVRPFGPASRKGIALSSQGGPTHVAAGYRRQLVRQFGLRADHNYFVPNSNESLSDRQHR